MTKTRMQAAACLAVLGWSAGSVSAQCPEREGATAANGFETGLVSDFDCGDLAVGFGAGWAVSTDQLVGGTSTAALAVADGGAEGSVGSMSIVGEIKQGPSQTWAGGLFSPGTAPRMPEDLSSKQSISFWAKGDGRTYFLMLFLQSEGGIPQFRTFATGPNWEEYVFPLSEFNGTDAHDLTGVFFGASGEPGEFIFQIDDVRFARGEPASRGARKASSVERNNLVHADGYQTVPLGTIGRVETIGTGSRHLIMIPGSGKDGAVFKQFAELNQKTYTMVLVTPPGFAETPAPPMPDATVSYGDRTWSRAFEEAVWSLIEERGLKRPILVGFSDGLQHAMRIALEHQAEVAAVVSIAGELYRELGWPVSADERAQAVDTRLAQGWFKRVSEDTWRQGMVQADWYSALPAVGESLFEDSLKPPIPVMVRYYCEKWSYDPRPELAGLQVPVLALLPDSSAFTENWNYQQYLKNALVGPWEAVAGSEHITIVTIPGARAGMLLDHTRQVQSEIASFLNRVE